MRQLSILEKKHIEIKKLLKRSYLKQKMFGDVTARKLDVKKDIANVLSDKKLVLLIAIAIIVKMGKMRIYLRK